MDGTWSLAVLYQGFQDKRYAADMKRAEALLQEYEKAARSLKGRDPEKALEEIIERKEELYNCLECLRLFSSLTRSVDMGNQEACAACEKLSAMYSRMAVPEAKVRQYIASVDHLEKVIENSSYLQGYQFLLKEIKKEAEHSLPEEAEEVFARMDLTGGDSWANMRDYLVSAVTVEYGGEALPLAQLRNLAHSGEEQVRREAYEAELSAYEPIKEPVAFALSGIKQQVNTEAALRKYESPLDMTLERLHMKRETLNAMLSAIEEALPSFWRYLKRKGKIFGREKGLAWWDLFAPVGKSERTFTVYEAKEYLVKHFSSFAPDMADMIETAFEENWIDLFPRKGKAGGASCCSVHPKKQFRIQTNFSGTLSDVVTLAHELGHGFHSRMIDRNLPLNIKCPAPLAETASTFNETVIMEAAIKEASGEEKLFLLESRLQDITQIMCDIYSRFLFESAVFKRRTEEFLFSGTLCDMMLEAQKTAYGDGLDPDTLHPYMWICKGHYYSSGLSFYNFPYAFGGLFAIGLYSRYMEEGSSFVEKYRRLLTATTTHSIEEVAAMAGVDITKPDFWRESLAFVKCQIEEFLELTKEYE